MTEWTTKDGKVLKIVDMETTHIEKCIKMLENQIEELEDIGEDFIVGSGDTDGTCNFGYWDIKCDIDRKKLYIKAFMKELKGR